MLGGNAFLGRTDQVDRQEPLSQRQMGVVKDGPGGHRVLIMAVFALIKVAHFLGFSQGFKLHHPGATALNTHRAIGPTDTLKMFDALFFGVEAFDNLKNGRGLVHG